MYKILMVDDDQEVLQINKLFFEQKDCEVYLCVNSLEVVQTIRKQKPDCILLDIMMPKINGYHLCRQIRTFTNMPILFLSGKVSEESKIEGFSCGADDYIEKPYSLNELYIRIVSNIKRNHAVAKVNDSNLFHSYPLTINFLTRKVWCVEEEVYLPKQEYELLSLLVKKSGELVTFEEIGLTLWGSYSGEDRRVIMVIMSRLRKKFSKYMGMENKIITIWSKGYQFFQASSFHI